MRNGAQAISLSAAGDHALFIAGADEMPLWPESQIKGLFPAGVDLETLITDLRDAFCLRSLPEHHVEDLEDRPW